MFNKLKQFKDLRGQAKNIQNQLSDEKTEVEKNGIKVTMDGNMKVLSVEIKEENNNKEELNKKITEAMNDAIKKTQKNMAAKVQQMGGLPGM